MSLLGKGSRDPLAFKSLLGLAGGEKVKQMIHILGMKSSGSESSISIAFLPLGPRKVRAERRRQPRKVPFKGANSPTSKLMNEMKRVEKSICASKTRLY